MKLSQLNNNKPRFTLNQRSEARFLFSVDQLMFFQPFRPPVFTLGQGHFFPFFTPSVIFLYVIAHVIKFAVNVSVLDRALG